MKSHWEWFLVSFKATSCVKMKIIFCVLFIFVSVFGYCQCSEDLINEEFENAAKMYSKWVQKTMTPDTFAYHSNLLKSNSEENVPMSAVLQYYGMNSDSIISSLLSQCHRDLLYLVGNLESAWAISMLDSYGKIPGGVLRGNFKWIGDYNECLNVYAPARYANITSNITFDAGNFHGRYCSSTWQLNLGNISMPLTIGLCLPDSCSGGEVKSDLNIIFILLELIPALGNISSTLNLTDISCKPLHVEFDHSAIGMLFLLSVIGLLLVTGSSITIFEYYIPAKKNDSSHSSRNLFQNNVNNESSSNTATNNMIIPNEGGGDDMCNGTSDNKNLLDDDLSEQVSVGKKIAKGVKLFFQSFCIFTNGAKILNTDVSEGQMLSIHGIRFLSMAWVILGHTYVFAGMYVIANTLDTLQALDTWTFQVIVQGTYSVDSFFVMSGFLLTYLFLKEADKTEGKISWPMFYIHRYWRLTPVYMVVLGFDTAITRYLSSGPFWLETTGFDANCRESWWRNLLYINNFGDSTKQCFGWAWYLANDMQFYVISPIFLYALWRWPKVGLSIVSALILSSWIASGIISTNLNLMGGYTGISEAAFDMQDFLTRMADYFWQMYVKPYTRISPYLIGVLLGYILYKVGNKKKFLGPWSQILGWSFGTALPLVAIFGLYHTQLNTSAAAAYNALSRSVFSLGLAWVIFACQTGHGDLINKILSWRMFIPLSRLTYCAYLVHPIVIIGFYMSQKEPLYFSNLTMVTLFFGMLVMSYIIAFITSLALESPTMAIEKLVLRKK